MKARALISIAGKTAARSAAFGVFLAIAGSASAADRAAAPLREPADQLSVSVSYALNLPLNEGALLVDAANNRAYKRSLYQKAASECEDFIATIARSCAITNIGVSTQENRFAGQPATLYVSINVTMQITPK